MLAKHKSLLFTLLWVFVSIFSRIIPHPANATAMISLGVWAPLFFSRNFSVWLMLASLFISDVCLHVMFGYPVVGGWSLFTYSGLLLLVFLAQNKTSNMFLITANGALLYWLWTNFGSWISTNMYAHTVTGIIDCYIAAIPFLMNNLISSLIYTCGLYYLYAYHQKAVLTSR